MFLEGNSSCKNCAETASCAETARQEAEEVKRQFLICFFFISLIRKGRVSQVLGKSEEGDKGRYKGLFYGPEALYWPVKCNVRPFGRQFIQKGHKFDVRTQKTP